ncbi:hypothetical protein [Gandjariella thermophila]|uniref:Uncharacterized protein n=1 Tax=Gandjariella thermophila TaxID=1931992 RepID=A0A4D4J7G1_9PSEU|nr:hypothetical protein [Gandjariella thermophila]GDY29803.1 hypothetical protein GTS_14360 [Gandjariella thermophila]
MADLPWRARRADHPVDDVDQAAQARDSVLAQGPLRVRGTDAAAPHRAAGEEP